MDCQIIKIILGFISQEPARFNITEILNKRSNHYQLIINAYGERVYYGLRN